MVEQQTCDQEVGGSTPGQALLYYNLMQVVHSLVPLSPSSIIWY